MLTALGAFGLVIAETPVVRVFARPLEVAVPLQKADAIVILGGGVRFDGELRVPTLERLIYGLRLFRQGYASRLILTGGNPNDPALPESVQMLRVVQELGLPSADVIVETKAMRTVDQAKAVAAILQGEKLKSVILVTSRTHSLRAVRAFRKAGITVIPGTVDVVRSNPGAFPRSNDWFATTIDGVVGRFTLFSLVIYEYAAMALYWWNGWI